MANSIIGLGHLIKECPSDQLFVLLLKFETIKQQQEEHKPYFISNGPCQSYRARETENISW